MEMPGLQASRARFLRICLLLLSVLASVSWSQKISSGNLSSKTADHASENKGSALDATKEDWSLLSLANSKLHASTPLLGEKDSYPDFSRELLQVQWRTGDPIDLYVILPKVSQILQLSFIFIATHQTQISFKTGTTVRF
jgi:hypothetical protein